MNDFFCYSNIFNSLDSSIESKVSMIIFYNCFTGLKSINTIDYTFP
jgi:hypothetical protein